MIYINARFLSQPVTGVQRFAIEISLQLKKFLGKQVCFIAPSNIIHRDLANQLGVIQIGSRTGHLWEQLDLTVYLRKRGNPLLLNFANTAPLFYTNKISTIHDVAFLVYPRTYSKTFLWSYRFLIPRVIYSSKLILTVSEFSKQEILRYYHVPESSVKVIYNAVSDIFHKVESRKGRTSDKYFLAVSSLNYRKNFRLILQAFCRFNESFPDYRLLIIGDLKTGNFGDLNMDDYKKHQNIRFLGRIDDNELVRYYRNAFAFLYPSFYEGFGIPPLEAQACGCPIIVSETSSLPEIFGDSAFYCHPDSVDSLYARMRDMASHNSIYNLLTEKGEKNVLRFSWSDSAKKIIESLKTLQLLP